MPNDVQDYKLPYPPSSPPGTGVKGGGFNWGTIGGWIESPFEWGAHQVENTVTWGGEEVIRVAGFASKVVTGVSRAVFHFVNVFVHTLESLVTRLVGVLHHMIASLFTLVHGAAKLAAGAVDWVKHADTWVAGILTSWGKSFYNNVVLPGIHAAVDAVKAAGKVADGVINGIKAFDKWSEGKIAGFAKDLANLPALAGKAATALLDTFNKDVVSPIAHDVDKLTTTVGGITKVLTADTLNALKVLGTIGDWIVLLAEYTVADIESLPAFLEGGVTGGDLKSKATLPDQKTMDAIQAAVGKLLEGS